jgi:hypothetical protein
MIKNIICATTLINLFLIISAYVALAFGAIYKRADMVAFCGLLEIIAFFTTALLFAAIINFKEKE